MASSIIGTMIFDAAKSAGMLGVAAGQSRLASAGAAVGAKAKAIRDAPGKAIMATGGALAGGAKAALNPMNAIKPMLKVAQMAGSGIKALGNPKNIGKAAINGPKGMVKGIAKLGSKGLGMAGISLSVSSLLRQSQLFTGMVGALFQVIGGLVDVLLAPFMPYAFKLVSMLAEQIPKVAEMSRKVHDWLANNVFPIIAEWAGKIGGWILGGWSWIKNTLWPITKDLLGKLWDWSKALWSTVQPYLAKTWESFKTKFAVITGFIKESIPKVIEYFKMNILPILSTIVTTVGTAIKDTWNWLNENIVPIFKNIWGIVEDKIPAIMALVTTIKDVFLAKIKEVFVDMKAKMEPILIEVRDKILEIFEKLQLIVGPLIDLLIPLIKLIVKVGLWFVGKMFDVLAVYYTFLWKYVGRPILSIISWLLDGVPRMLREMTQLITDPLQFLKDIGSSILTFMAKILGGMVKFKIGTPFGDIKPFEFMQAGVTKLETMAASMAQSNTQASSVRSNQAMASKKTEQEQFDAKSINVNTLTGGMGTGADMEDFSNINGMIGAA